jgi:hypothetical protein
VNVHVPGLTAASNVRIEFFTTAFRKIRDISFAQVPVGTDVRVALTDNWGNELADGIYYVVVTSSQGRSVAKLLLLK